MQFLSEWISNIILLILLATILELLLPNSSLQRYVKMVVGLLLLVIILNPLFSIFSKDADSWISSIGLSQQYEEKNIEISVENKKKEIERVQLAYISEQVAVQLERQVEEELIKKFEKEIIDLNITLNDFLNEEDYLNSVTNVTVKLKSFNQEENKRVHQDIEPVSLVSINTTTQVVRPKIDETKDEELSSFLAKQWSIPIEKIEIVMEGGNGIQ